MITRSIGMVLLFSALLFANTYYIDYAGGSDANPGTSKSAPWKRCPGMTGCTAPYSHVPGDAYIFKGGVTWPSAALPFTIANSGTSGNTDTYTTDHTWFSGTTWSQPTFDGQLFGKTLLSVADRSYIKIDDLRLVNAGSLSANGIMAFQFINCSYLELSNNTFAPESWGCLYISTEKTGDYYNILVHHNDLSHCAFAMRIVPAAASSVMHNVLIYNNNIHDFHSQLSGAVHGDGIQHYCSPDQASSFDRYVDGFKIYNNHFYGDFSQVSGSGGAMTALVYLSGSSIGVQIYNNVFAPQYSGSQSPNFFESYISLRDNPNRGGHHKIYNNTFVTPVAGGQSAALLEDDTRFPSPFLDVKNNIFSNFNWPFDLRSTNHTFDNNDDNFVRDIGKWAGNFVGSFANWQALGLDVHGQSVIPVFVSSIDQHLGASSPCIKKGADLSAYFSTDIEGNARPASGGFSLGAYEYGATPPPAVPAAPVLSSPSNGATGIAVNPMLSWNAVSGALSYYLQVSAVSTFASTIINQAGISSASYQASGLSNNTTYYWRVNAANANGTGNWSSTGNFQTVAIVLPAAPTPASPANGATGVAVNPTLSWNAVSGALSYSLQVSTDSAFASTKINQAGITAPSYQASGLANNTKYYWRVNASGANGTGGWSSIGNFRTLAIVLPAAPVLSSPSNGATGIAVNPTLSWNAVSGAVSYSLQVSTVSTFATTILNQTGITSASYQASGLSNNVTFYWRVNAANANGTGSWSSTRNFTTVALAAANLQLWWPGNGATGVVVNPSLTWGPDSTASSYGLQVASDSGFAAIVLYKSGITANSYDANILQNGTLYYWRVNAVRAGSVSAWSPFWKFTTAAGVPSAPGLSLPSNNATGVAINPVFSWNAVPGAVSYALQVSTSAGFASTIVNKPGIASTSYQVTGLLNAAIYYWRVDASNAAGAGAWSTAGNFTTDAAPSPTLALWWPANGATGVVINPSLTWSPETGALSYALQVSVDSAFSAPLLYQSGITANSFDVNVLAANTSYFWRVNATKSNGTCGWSKAYRFTTGGVLGKNTSEISAVHGRPDRAVLDIYSCRAGAVQLSLPFPGPYTLSIFTLAGKEVGTVAENAGSAGPVTASLKNRNLQQGYYVMRLSIKDAVISKKIYLIN